MQSIKTPNNAADSLKRIAKLLNHSQTAIAKEAGISRITVNRFLKGHCEVRTTDFINICSALGINIDEAIQARFQEVVDGIVQRG